MTAANGQLYIYQNSRLWRVSPATGVYTQIGAAEWTGTTSMTQLYGGLYVIQNDRLYSVDPSNGTYQVLGGANWGGPTFIGSTIDRP